MITVLKCLMLKGIFSSDVLDWLSERVFIDQIYLIGSQYKYFIIAMICLCLEKYYKYCLFLAFQGIVFIHIL